MRKSDVADIRQAFVYIADCQLATVSRLAMLKSKSKGDYTRQIAIAQTMVDWCIRFQCDYAGTRVHAVITNFNQSVQSWADAHAGGCDEI